MKTLNIKISPANADIGNFVNIVSKFTADMDICIDRYIVDAKSIMGIFSLDLSKTLELRYFDKTEEQAAAFEQFQNDIKTFIV